MGFNFQLSNTKPPCGKNCPERYVGCKSTCLRWADYEQLKAAEYEQRKILRDQIDAAHAGEARRYKNFGTAKSGIRHGKGMRGK